MSEDGRAQAATGRREEILRAAGGVFAQRGVHGARIDDIAAAAGVSKGSVYWYFTSKDEVVYALLDDFYAGAHRDLLALQNQPGSVAERLRGYLPSFAQLLVENQALAPLVMEFYALAPRQPRVREFLERYYTDYAQGLAVLLEQGNQHGELAVADPHGAARTLVELFEGATVLWILTPDITDLTHRLLDCFELIYHGLAARHG